MLSRVLLTNDDGIDAPGLEVLRAVVAELASEVVVVAPVDGRSGYSHQFTIGEAIKVEARGSRHLAVHGTPVDCVRLGLDGLSYLLANAPPPESFWNVNLPHPEPGSPEPRLARAPLDRSPLPIAYQATEAGWLFHGRFADRRRQPDADIDVCLRGDIALTLLPA